MVLKEAIKEIKNIYESTLEYNKLKYYPVFFQHIMDGKELKLGGSGKKGNVKILIDDNIKHLYDLVQKGDLENVKELIYKKPIFVDEYTGKKYRYTNFFKGTFSGYDGVKIDTKTQETYNAFYYAIIVNELGDYENVDQETFNKAKSYVYSDYEMTYDRFLEISRDTLWEKSAKNSALAFYNEFKDIIQKPMNFLRGTGLMSILEKQYNKVEFVDEEGNKKAKPKRDKWNPMDILGVSINDMPNIQKEVKNALMINSLNSIIAQYFDEGKLYPISLKKVGENPKVEIFNKVPYEILIEKAFVQPIKIFTNDIYIESEKALIQFRSFDSDGAKSYSVQGEIKGEFANQGKIGEGPINYILEDIGLPTIIDKDLKTNKDLNYMANLLYDWFNTIKQEEYKFSDYKKLENKDKFIKEAIKKGRKYIYSKIFEMKLLDSLNNNNKKINEFTKQAILYAKSQLDISSVFVKIS